MTQEDISRITGLSTDKISKYERNTYTLSVEELQKLEDLRNKSVAEIRALLEASNDSPHSNSPQKFQKDNHIIFLGDAIEVLSDQIDDGTVDLIFADPPYNIGKLFEKGQWGTEDKYISWCYQWIDLCLLKLKKNGSFYLMAATQFMPYFDIYLRDKVHIKSRIVWYYDSSGRQAKHYFGSLYEPILHLVKDKNDYVFNASQIQVEAKTGAKRKLIDYRKKPPQQYNSTKVPGNVWEIPRVRYRMEEYEEHPSQKPEELLERIILASSNEDDVVLDPFSGTFTTSVVAKRLHRRSIGIEIDQKFVKIGLRRLDIQNHLGDDFLHKPRKTYNRNTSANTENVQ